MTGSRHTGAEGDVAEANSFRFPLPSFSQPWASIWGMGWMETGRVD